MFNVSLEFIGGHTLNVVISHCFNSPSNNSIPSILSFIQLSLHNDSAESLLNQGVEYEAGFLQAVSPAECTLSKQQRV